MIDQKTCPTCKGNKIIIGHCECNAEWRNLDNEYYFDACRCEPEIKCPDCHGKGFIG